MGLNVDLWRLPSVPIGIFGRVKFVSVVVHGIRGTFNVSSLLRPLRVFVLTVINWLSTTTYVIVRSIKQ